MSLSQTQKQSLLRELYQLSTDTELMPYLDEPTTIQINKLFETANFQKEQIDSLTPVRPQKKVSSMSKKKYKTQIQEIQEINQQYQQKFAHLFTSDEDNDCNILKEIDIHLNSNIGKSAAKQNNFLRKNFQFNETQSRNPQLLHSKSTKQVLSKKNSKNQNINSLTSTHSNLFHTKTNEQLSLLKRKSSKEKLISYKIKTETSKSIYDVCTPSPNKLLKKKEKTPIKQTLTGSQSKGNLQPLVKSPLDLSQNCSNLMKRSQSQSTKFLITTNPVSLNSTSKHEKLPLLRPSESKSSLSTAKLKSGSKKSISVLETTTGTKRQLNSLPSIDIESTQNLRAQILKGTIHDQNVPTVLKIRESKRSKSKSKEKHSEGMKKGMKRLYTQSSVQKIHLKEDFLEQMRADDDLKFYKMNENQKHRNMSAKKPYKKKKQTLVTQPPELKEHKFSQEFFFYESSSDPEPNSSHEERQSIQIELQQEKPMIFQENSNSKMESKCQESSINTGSEQKNSGYEYLKKIMVEIYQKRQEKVRQKVKWEREIAQLKEKLTQQKKFHEATLLTNSKLQNELVTVNSYLKAVSNERSLLSRCLQQTRKTTTSLKQTISKGQNTLTKLINQDLKEQQDLIEMYNNVIEELRSEIKEQFKKKVEAKNQLQVSHKKKQGKLTKFNSTLLSSQRLKHNLTDAFKEWV